MMSKRLKNAVIVVGLFLQMVIVVLYGFTEVEVSNYGCLALWCVCGIAIYHAVGKREIIS